MIMSGSIIRSWLTLYFGENFPNNQCNIDAKIVLSVICTNDDWLSWIGLAFWNLLKMTYDQ